MAIAKAAPAKAPVGKPAAAPAKPALTKPNGAASAASPAALIAGAAGTLKESSLTVTTTVLANGTIQGEPVEEREVSVRLFATTPAMAVAGVKIKKNLGNYDSVEFFVSQTVPAYVEDLESVQQQVNENVLRILDERFAAFDPATYGLGGGDAGENSLTDVAGGEGEAEAAGAEGEAEEGGITPEYIAEASREDLVAIVEGNPDSFSFSPDDYPDDDDLRSMMTTDLWPEDVPAAEQDPGEGYTEEQLLEASMEELAAVYEAWEMGAFPKFNAKNESIVKKKAVKDILAKQAEAAAAAA